MFIANATIERILLLRERMIDTGGLVGPRLSTSIPNVVNVCLLQKCTDA